MKIMNEFEYLEEQTRKQQAFIEGLKAQKINLYSDTLLQEMSTLDYLGIPFLICATNSFFKNMYYEDILMIMASLLTKYGIVKILKDDKDKHLIFLEQDNHKYLFDISGGLVYAYDTYLTLENTSLIEIINVLAIKDYILKSNNITRIYHDDSRRIVLNDQALNNYKLGIDKMDFAFITMLSDYLLNKPDSLKGVKFQLKK